MLSRKFQRKSNIKMGEIRSPQPFNLRNIVQNTVCCCMARVLLHSVLRIAALCRTQSTKRFSPARPLVLMRNEERNTYLKTLKNTNLIFLNYAFDFQLISIRYPHGIQKTNHPSFLHLNTVTCGQFLSLSRSNVLRSR